jgi:hypothetical protein
MDVIDHVRATQAQHRPDPEQLRVVEVVQVGSLTRGGAPDPPAHARHAVEPPAGAVNRHDSHAVADLRAVVTDDQADIVANPRNALALPAEDPGIVGGVRRRQVTNRPRGQVAILSCRAATAP